MSLKLKALGLGLLATLAMSAVAVMNASATSTGHFVSDSPNGKTTIIGSENPQHFTELTSHGLEGGIVCDKVAYHGTFEGNTSTHIAVSPTYSECHTTGAAAGTTVVTVNGCTYTFTPGHAGTVHLDCPVGSGIEIHHPNCTIRITPQTVSGVKYTTEKDAFSGKHNVTLDANTVQFNSEYEGGICVFTGTNHTGTLHGSATVKGFQDEGVGQPPGPQVNVTHTATEGE